MNITGNARYQFTEEIIEKAVMNLLKRKNYDSFSVKDICVEAVINRTTFYAHYEDINDFMIKFESKLSKRLEKIWKPTSDFRQQFIDFFTFIKEHRVFYKAFAASGSQSFTAADMLKKQKEHFKQFTFRQSINYTDAEMDYHLHWFGGGLKAICGRWIQNNCKESPEEMAKIIHDEYANNAKM